MKQLFVSTLLFVSLFASGQNVPSGGRAGGASTDTSKNFQFLPIPYINYSRSVGAAFGLVPMAMYKVNPEDTVSPASMTGLVGMITTNETWFGMFFQKLYLKEDTWRITAAGGLSSINFQFYLEGIGPGFIDYNTQADFFYVDAQRKITRTLYGGVQYLIVQTNTTFEGLPSVENVLHGTGLKFALDNRDDVYYPQQGYVTNASWTTFPDFFGNDYVSNKIDLDHNHFFSIGDSDVIGLRAKVGLGIGEVAFEQQFIVGQTDIRGYTQGEFRGDNLLALQGEYRWNFHARFGVVGFVGFATIWESVNEEDNGVILPGVGTGFRFNAFPDNHMNVGMDAAIGKNDWGIYFRIGEAF